MLQRVSSFGNAIYFKRNNAMLISQIESITSIAKERASVESNKKSGHKGRAYGLDARAAGGTMNTIVRQRRLARVKITRLKSNRRH